MGVWVWKVNTTLIYNNKRLNRYRNNILETEKITDFGVLNPNNEKDKSIQKQYLEKYKSKNRPDLLVKQEDGFDGNIFLIQDK